MARCIARKPNGNRCQQQAPRKLKSRRGTGLCAEHHQLLLTGAKPLLEAVSGKPIRKPRA